MAKLSEQQLMLAAEAWRESAVKQNDPMGANLHVFKRALEVAAPYLQLPWDEPTREEIAVMCQHLYGRERGYEHCVLDVMLAFVRRRNAALAPKPQDPRREKILRCLYPSQFGDYSEGHNAMADRIIAALDKE